MYAQCKNSDVCIVFCLIRTELLTLMGEVSWTFLPTTHIQNVFFSDKYEPL
jgi:hypothetical protein